MNRVAGLYTELLCKRRSYHRAVCIISRLFVQPLSVGDFPPASHACDAGVQLFAGRQFHVMIEPCSDSVRFCTTDAYFCIDERCIVNDVERPEYGLYLAELVFAQISYGCAAVLDFVQRVHDRVLFRYYRYVSAVGLELLINLVAHIEHYAQHRGGK